MKPNSFELNSPGMFVQYHRMREGPNYFVLCYNGSARLTADPLTCWRMLGVAKFTDTGKQLKQWCLEQVIEPKTETNDVKSTPSKDSKVH